ncbi:MAG: hypothetical protein K2N48_07795 [Muribaculaceae bacterium]|nr:hypothetical protein [Muribaculaceae bacterium]
MKKLLLAMMLSGALLGNAETPTADFSYIDGVTESFRTNNAETFDVAILLPGSIFEGYRIKTISTPLCGEDGIDNYSQPKVWLATALKVEDGANVADIGCWDAEVSLSGTDALLSGDVKDMYTIPADGVYVGFSIHMDKVNDYTAFALGDTDYNDSFWLHAEKTTKYKNWSDTYKEFGYGCAISVTLEKDDMPEHAVKIVDVPDNVYMALDTPQTFDLTLSATGSQSVTSVDFEYVLEGKSYTYHYDLPEAVSKGIQKRFNAALEIPAQAELADEIVEFKVAKVNGEDNPYIEDSAKSHVNVLKMIPVRQALFEEYTSTGCQYCTRGYAALAHVKENYPDFVTASYHVHYGGSVDPMAVVSNLPVSVSGYPSSSLDRNGTGDPYFGKEIYSTKIPIVDEILAINSTFTPWSIKVSHNWESDDLLTATVEAFNVLGYEKGRYKIAYILVADGLKGEGGWTQLNGLASSMQSDKYVSELNDFCRGGKYASSRVNGLVFDDVVIYGEGYNGVTGSVPDNLAAYEEMTHSFTFDLSKVKQSLLQDKNKLRVIAAVVNNNGKILNCAKDEVNDYVGAGVESVGDADAPVEYYNINGVKVSEPSNGIFIRKQGSKTEKVIIR